MSYSAMRRKRFTAGVLAGAMALTVMPILGFTGTAGALEPATGDGSVCEDPPEAEPFTDVSDADPSLAEIECLVNTGITTGVTATTYEPNSPVTRRQMALFLVRLADVAEAAEIGDEVTELPAGDGETDFTDVGDEAAEIQEAIDRLADAGIAEGVTTTTFVPGSNVTRRQMAKFIVRLQDFLAGDQDITPNDPDDAFTDDDGDSGEDELNILAEEGIFLGDGAGNVNPGDDISRRQMANVIIRKAQYLFEEGLIDRLFEEDDVEATATTRPELQAAQIVSTTTAGQATATNPAGTVVAYTFDEPVTAVGPAGSFNVYDAAAAQTSNGAGSATISSGDNRTVNVLYPGIATTAAASALTTATVELGAVTDTSGQQSPEGDAGIGTGGESTLAAGTTAAPDLLSVGGFRGTTTPGTVAVDFTFDQNAFVQTGGAASDFWLISQDGRTVQCTAPAEPSSGNTTPSGQNTPGGNGTTVITATCGQFPGAVPLTASASNVARGVTETGAVGTTPPVSTVNGVTPAACGAANSLGTTNRCNPLQASNTPDVASVTPDLVSASFTPAPNPPAGNDQVTYTFDENVQPGTVDNTDFFVYNSNGVETTGLAAPAPQVSGAQVAVFYPAGTLANAVGASVNMGAVTAVAGTNLANLDDEVGVANPTATTSTPGLTGAPDLTDVALSSSTSGFTTTWTATYTVDEPLGAAVTAAGVAPQLFLHLSDGARMVCTAAGNVTIGTGLNGLTTSQVSCNNFTFVDGAPDQSGTNAGVATAAQVGSAVLGTVDRTGVAGTLQDAGGNFTPEGAELTTGGTGTPAS